VNNQTNAGTNGVYWPDSVRISGSQSTATFGLLVMAPGLVELPPVANAGVDQEVAPGEDVDFDGSASTHSDPARSIVAYEWDYDYDGITFDVEATGAMVTKVAGYPITNGTDTQDYTVALRVRDDNSPPLTSTDTLVVTVTNGNVAPVADPGGPYLGAVNEDIVLDGSGSYDDNSQTGANPLPASGSGTAPPYDGIVSYKWDTDGDGLYGDEDTPPDPMGVSPTVQFTSLGTKSVGLKVTDSYGRSAAQSSQLTTVAISDLYPVSYVQTQRLYDRRSRTWYLGWKVNIRNDGTGAATAVSAVLSGSSIPPAVTVIDGSVAWSGNIDPAETQLSDDQSLLRCNRVDCTDLSQITWDIEFTDALGTRHVIRSVPQ
jgi:hypothetical protein